MIMSGPLTDCIGVFYWKGGWFDNPGHPTLPQDEHIFMIDFKTK